MDSFSPPIQHLREALKQEAASMSIPIRYLGEADVHSQIWK
jgi:hypothetical protein